MRVMRQLGDEGWEMIIRYGAVRTHGNVEIWFKRPLEDEG